MSEAASIRQEKERISFCEQKETKKLQKFFGLWPWNDLAKRSKSFLVLFSKKNSLFLLTFLIFGRLGSYKKAPKNFCSASRGCGTVSATLKKSKFFASFRRALPSAAPQR
jgi:hypothetical protein